MPAKKNDKNTDSNNESSLTLKEVSNNLGISETTIKRYLKEFDLPVEGGIGSKTVISSENFLVLTEIAKLRANGLSIQEIKELKGQQPSKNILDEMEEDDTKKEVVEDSVDELKPQDVKDVKEISDDIEDNGRGDEDKALEEELDALQASSANEDPVKRRGFNYRYVERQISSDSKKVASFRRRLQNPNISIHEKLFFEEALERRILFLNGWKHILRWVSKQ